MTTTILRPDSAVSSVKFHNNASETASSTTADIHARPEALRQATSEAGRTTTTVVSAEQPSISQFSDSSIGMTEDDTVSVLEVLEEMQRIIDRHLEKTEKLQD